MARNSTALSRSGGISKFLLQVKIRPLLLLLAANLLVALLVYQDYGLSWDEPLFYQYADAIGYAYSIPERLSGNFDLEKAYGPSAGDHKTYGPAYLLLARPLVGLLDVFLPARVSDLWHLVNFLTFQVGLVFFYGLARRWLDEGGAFAAAAFFATQPVLWGHAWINPKDIPFLVFFLGAVLFGLKMVDQMALHSQAAAVEAGAEGQSIASPVSPSAQAPFSPRLRRLLFWLKTGSAVVFLAAALLFLLRQPLEGLLGQWVESLYHAPAGSMPGRIFAYLAPQAGQVPVDSYVQKSLTLLARLRLALALLAAVLFPFGLLAVLKPAWIQLALKKLESTLAPLPTLPLLWLSGRSLKRLLPSLLLAALFLGLLSSVRVLGPLAGVLVAIYFLVRFERRAWLDLGLYALAAFAVMFAAWPYLWEAPLARLWEVARHMSSNPQILSVVFNGAEHPSNRLPAAYLPTLLGVTLTEPVWLLFAAGLFVLVVRISRRELDWRSVLPVLLWFFLPFAYVILTTPPMYDGYRHFLFILPPVFLVAGLFFQWLRQRAPALLANGLLLLALAPGLVGLVRSHPYQYAYFNTLTGGTGGAFRQYETDYWLTCYREIMAKVNRAETGPVTLFVHRQPGIAREYAASHIEVKQYDADNDNTFPGSLLLLSSRTGVDYKIHPDSPVVYEAGKDGAVFCLIRRVE